MSTQFQNANKIKFMPLPYIGMYDLDVIYQTSDAELLYQVLYKLNEIAKSQNIIIDNFQKVIEWATEQIEKFTKEQLEEWLNDGTLENFILQLGNIVKYVDTTTEMGTINNLVNGQTVITLGYYKAGDGGGATFKIVDSEPDTFNIALPNNLYAKMIYDDFLDVVKCGVDNTGTNDIYNQLNPLLTYGKLKFQGGTYLLKQPLTITTRQIWISDYDSNYDILPTILLEGNDTSITITQQKTCFNGITFSTYENLNNTATTGLYIQTPFVEFNNCNIYYFSDFGVNMSANCWLCSFNKCRIEHNGVGVRTHNNCNNTSFINCYIHMNTTGVYVYGSTDQGGSPYINFEGCNIEDNTSSGITITGSLNNSVFINRCYFEHHDNNAFAIWGRSIVSDPQYGYRYLEISNSRFYCGTDTNNCVYLYYCDLISLTNCEFGVSTSNENTFYMINIGANVKNVVLNGVTYYNLTENITSFNTPDKVKSNDIMSTHATASADFPKNCGSGAICLQIPGSGYPTIANIKFFDGTNWRNNDGTIVGQ